jgi:NAD dependent epimerase/dehydratase family enzyme
MTMPGVMLRLALGEVANVVLDGQHVTPTRAIASGFTFRFPELEPALRELLR